MKELFKYLTAETFMPHGGCLLWRADLVWMSVLADSLIALAYYSIPLAILYFVRKRRDLVFPWIFILFGMFIFACGTTHLISVWNTWHSNYAIEGIVKLITALISLTTAVLLWIKIPKVLEIPGPEQLKKINMQLLSQAEDYKRVEGELRQLNRTLEEKVAERTDELTRSNFELKQFAYIASHDLQQPLRTIISFAELLRMRLEGIIPVEAEEYFRLMEEGAARMQKLITDLLAFAQIGSNNLVFENVDTRKVLESVLANLHLQIEETQTTVTFGALPIVRGSFSLLEQLLQNLIANAIKYRSKTALPAINIEVIEREAQWEFCVRDNGIGIAPEHHEQVFEIFRRLHTQKEYSGTGIGLAICRKIVQLHSGNIWVEGQLGAGCTFHFCLPRH